MIDGARTALKIGELHASLADPVLASMNFLNEVTARFPDAVSFAPGAPYDGFLHDLDVEAALHRYLGHRQQSMASLLLPYGAAAGQINDLLAEALRTEEGIETTADAIVVTVGCQEALFVTLRTLFADPEDVLLSVEPCYVGLTGAAALLDIDVVSVPETAQHSVRPADVAAVCETVRRSGRRPRALYVVPDFTNPSGRRLSLEDRRQLLAVAAEQDILLLEDNPYGFTARPSDAVATLKALDRSQRVVYLGTLSKVCAPGLRVGFAVADQEVVRTDGSIGLLADALTAVKSMITVNTSPISQAIAGGMLLTGNALRDSRKARHYQANLDALTTALNAGLPDSVRWSAPEGGFFVLLELPFAVGAADVAACARDYGVLFTPMDTFYRGAAGAYRIRVSCSNLTPDLIATGAAGLCRFLRDRSGPDGSTR